MSDMLPSITSDNYTIGSAISELARAGGRADQWSMLAWADVSIKYRRTTLGPIWITLGLGASVASVGILYSIIFHKALAEYLPHFAAGLIAWTFLASSMSDSCDAFVASAALIKSIPGSMAVYAYRMVFRQLIMLTHNLLIVVLLWFALRWHLNWSLVLLPLGLALNVATAFGLTLFLAVAGARFRDVKLIISTVLQLAFLLTPVVWQPATLDGTKFRAIVDANPLYALIEVLRQPIVGDVPDPLTWLTAVVVTVLAVTLGMFSYARYRHYIAFWI